MLVELCASNYVTFDGLVNGANGIFKTSTTYCEKIIIWIMFQNIEYIRVGKFQSFIITRKNMG
jgi:hypothetical protein